MINRNLRTILILALGAGAAALFIFATPFGLALVNDSVQYMDGARNLLNGQGYSRLTGWNGVIPITNFPPFYSFVLAFLMALGFDSIAAAWWIGLVFISMNTVLVALIAEKVSGSTLLGLLAGGLVLVSDAFFRHHLFALTEPVFLFSYFVCLYLLILCWEQPRWSLALLAGIMAGLAAITRYIGVTLVFSGLVFLWLPRNDQTKRLKFPSVFVAGAAPVLLAWTIRNTLVSGNPTNRQFMLRSLAPDKIEEGIVSFWGWLLPEPFQIFQRFLPLWGGLLVLLCVVLVVMVLAGLWRLLRQVGIEPTVQRHARWLLSFQSLVYMAVLVVTILFIDASVNFETRIYMPVLNLLVILLAALLTWMWRTKGTTGRLLAAAAVLGLFLSFAEDTIDTIQLYRREGQGFAHSSWTESTTMAQVRQLPEVEIFTNRPQAINLLASRGSYILLSPINPATQSRRENYQQERETIRDRVGDGKAVLVIFNYDDLIKEPENFWMLELTKDLPVYFADTPDVIFGNLK